MQGWTLYLHERTCKNKHYFHILREGHISVDKARKDTFILGSISSCVVRKSKLKFLQVDGYDDVINKSSIIIYRYLIPF